MLTIELTEIKTPGNYQGRIAIGATSVFHNRLKELPGTLYSKLDQSWTISKTYPSALVIGGFARDIGAKVKPSAELSSWIKAEKAAWLYLAEQSETVDGGGGHGTLLVSDSDGKETVVPLFAHQLQDIQWLTYPGGPPGRLLLSDTGVGKTRSVILAAVQQKMFPALVMCPKGVVTTGWEAEFKRVAPGIRVGAAIGNSTQRRKQMDLVAAGELDVLVIGYEAMRTHTRFKGFPGVALKRCEKCGGAKLSDEGAVKESLCQAHEKELNKIGWQLIVADEGHRGLNPASNTRMAMGGVGRSAPAGCVRWLLTATPVSKRTKVDKVWSLLNWVDENAWPVKGSWTDRYCLQGYNDGGYMEVQGWNPATLPELHASLNAVSRRVLIDQALDLPLTLRGGSLVRTLNMGTEQARVYGEMRDEMLAKVEEGVITAQNIPLLTQRLAMLAGAVGYPGEIPGQIFLRTPSAKLDELVTMIENEELGDQWVMAFTSRKLLRVFTEELTKHGVVKEIGIIDGETKQADRDLAVTRFQGGNLPVVAFTHAAGGVGITLTRADTLVMVERPWSDWQEKQTLGRVRRAGMPDRSVRVIDLICANTVEYAQLERIGDDALVLEELVNDTKRLKAFWSGKSVA